MASDTRNVKLGVCKIFFDGIDLGYTKGGVEVSVTTETHRVEVDQFGKTPINEMILGRDLKVKVPMAETTLQNMVRIMPGATLVQTGGAKATGTFTPGVNVTAGQTIIIGGTTCTARAAGTANAALNEFNVGASTALTLTSLRDFINASTDINLAKVDASATATVLTLTYVEKGTEGNSFTIAAGTWASVPSGATLAGGSAPTAERVDVGDGVGVDLLAIAKELRLHPKNKLDSDKSEDFIVPKAATPGALTFVYKLDDERVYNVEFQGYPDVSTPSSKLFSVGDPTAA